METGFICGEIMSFEDLKQHGTKEGALGGCAGAGGARLIRRTLWPAECAMQQREVQPGELKQHGTKEGACMWGDRRARRAGKAGERGGAPSVYVT